MASNAPRIRQRFSVSNNFLQSRADIHLYSLLKCLATTLPEDPPREYLLKSVFRRHSALIKKICKINTTRTLGDHINRLVREGLIKRDSINIYNRNVECFLFPYNYNEPYQLVDKDILRVLVTTGNTISIKIYLYLLNCFSIKRDWIFTETELLKALGFSQKYTRGYYPIHSALLLLRNQKLVDFITLTTSDPGAKNELLFPRQRLRNVAMVLPPELQHNT